MQLPFAGQPGCMEVPPPGRSARDPLHVTYKLRLQRRPNVGEPSAFVTTPCSRSAHRTRLARIVRLPRPFNPNCHLLWPACMAISHGNLLLQTQHRRALFPVAFRTRRRCSDDKGLANKCPIPRSHWAPPPWCLYLYKVQHKRYLPPPVVIVLWLNAAPQTPPTLVPYSQMSTATLG